MRWAFVVGLWLATVFVAGWLRWVSAVVALAMTYFVGRYWWYRNGAPWRKVYFPMIDHYAFLSGAALELARQKGEKFHPRQVLPTMLRNAFQTGSESSIQTAVDVSEERFNDGVYKQEWFEILSAASPGAEEARLRETIDKQFHEAEASLRVRGLIADIIEARCGLEQKRAFWRALMRNEIT